MTAGAKLQSACQWNAQVLNLKRKTRWLPVVSLMEELADDSVLQEASSSEDDEFLVFLLIDSKERKSHVCIDNYFECIIPLYSVSDFRSHFRMIFTQ